METWCMVEVTTTIVLALEEVQLQLDCFPALTIKSGGRERMK